MPLTPLHLGPGLFLGMLTKKVFNLFAFLVGSVVMDFEPLIWLMIVPCYTCPHHGFFHSIIGGAVGSLVVAFALWLFREKLRKLSRILRIEQSFSFATLYFSSLCAWLIHVFFDSLTHYDVHPLWPWTYNHILIGRNIIGSEHLIFVGLGILGLLLFYKNYLKNYARH
ncbi:MAG: metal-dependent hydrolase [Patescibacteria group bacterium]